MKIIITADTVDVITAAATAAAALVAAWAVLSANRVARRAREHQRLEDRFDAAVALLTAYEEIQVVRSEIAPGHGEEAFDAFEAALEADAQNETLKLARARCIALLRSSEEYLPIARGAFFSHTKHPLYSDLSPDDWEKALERYDASPKVGDEERERIDVLRCRAEILAVIDELRKALAQ